MIWVVNDERKSLSLRTVIAIARLAISPAAEAGCMHIIQKDSF